MKKLIILLVLVFTTLLIAKDELLPTEKSLIQGELANGFKYTIKKNSKPKNRAEFRLVVKVGSLEEDNDQRGIAHFVEHMAFNGSKHFKKNELIEYLESTGVKFGAHLNANTGYEQTLYMLTIPLEKDNLKKTFWVFQDWAEGLNFNPKEFNKERGVILEEARMRDNAGFRIYNKSKKLFLGNSRYMDRLPIGKKDIIKNIPVNRAKEFYQEWYQPRFMHFIAVGDFNTTKIENMIKEYFSPLKNTNNKKRASREIKDNNTTRVLVVTDKELTQNSLSIGFIDILEDTKTKKDLKEAIIETIMYKLFNLKAKEQILKNNPKATSINLTTEEINSNKAIYLFNADYNNGDDLLALKELYELIKSFEKYGFSKNDFETIKKELLQLNEKEYKRVSDMKSSSIASSLVHCAIRNAIYIDYDYKYKAKKEILKNIKLQEVNKFFKKVVNFKDRFILFIDTNKTQISKEKVLDIINQTKAKDLTKTKKLPSKILNIDLNNTKIKSISYNKESDSYEYILKNGIKVLFKQTDFSKNRVNIKGFSFGGYSIYNSINDLNNAQKASSFVNKSGAGKFTNIDLRKILAGKSVSISTNISELTENINGSANIQDIQSMFELMYLKLTKPKIDKRVEKNIKKVLKSNAKKILRNPLSKFTQELSKWYQNNNPRVFFDTPKNIDKLDRNSMLKIFKDRFSDFNNFDFAIIGDINKTQIEPLINKYLANLPTKNRQENFIDRKMNYKKGKQYFNRNYNNKNISNIFLLYRAKIPFTQKKDISLHALISILKVRLRELIREEKSGVYGISVNGNIPLLRKNRDSSLTIYFTCDPKRKDELIKYIYNTIKEIKEKPVTQKELNTYKKKFKVTHEINMRENSYWLSKMINNYKFDIPLLNIYKLPKMIDNITPKDIKEIANDIFRENILQAELNPKD